MKMCLSNVFSFTQIANKYILYIYKKEDIEPEGNGKEKKFAQLDHFSGIAALSCPNFTSRAPLPVATRVHYTLSP